MDLKISAASASASREAVRRVLQRDARFSWTVMLVNASGSEAPDDAWRVRRWAGRFVMSWPSKRMRPPSTGSEPDTQLMRVVLPDPLGADQPEPLARLHVQGQAVHRGEAAEALAEVLDFQNGVHRSVAAQAADQAEDASGASTTKATSTTPTMNRFHLGGDRHGASCWAGCRAAPPE